jgi:two-component system, NtrC family, nitrogen regulation sensor histidine kinase GlnL
VKKRKVSTDSHKQILDHLVTAVVVLDGSLHIESMNSAAENLLHTSASHAEGRPLKDLILRSEHILPRLEKALQELQSFTERDVALRLPDNITEDVDVTVSIMQRPGLGPNALVIELQSLNRFKRINKDGASIARQETARQLIRGLAHEVKNPLGGIRGAAQLLERELPEEELKEYTAVIISEADRLKELVDRMLGPQRELQLTHVNIYKIFEHVIQLIEAERPNTIRWQRDYDPSIPDIEADESQIIQALLNILRNASQALHNTDEPQIILRSRVVRQFTIGAKRHRMVLHLDIIDNGPGIDPDLEERIFFPMISGRADGTGLGLAITQNIVYQHHGSIQVQTRPGQTCFSIYLPFTQTDYNKEIHAK